MLIVETKPPVDEDIAVKELSSDIEEAPHFDLDSSDS
jgi:hypothetical protein